MMSMAEPPYDLPMLFRVIHSCACNKFWLTYADDGLALSCSAAVWASIATLTSEA